MVSLIESYGMDLRTFRFIKNEGFVSASTIASKISAAPIII